MYTQFFGLNEKPFAITPDPRYLFMSERHGEGLAHLLYGVTDSGGFIQLTGEVGTGKTTLVRSLLGQLPAEVDVALILNPQVTVLEFLQAICKELGVPLPEDRNSHMALIDALNRHLLDAHSRGRRIILLVDEAQNLSGEVLEQLRLLTNLETAKQKLLQIILIGQPELREILAQNNLRQLAQRVTGRYHLEPLSKEEAAKYIDHRMKVAGGLGETFDVGAKREVYRLSGGIPRLMNVICDRALLGAYSQESRQVDRSLVRSAATEVSGKSSPSKAPRWLAATAAAATLAVIAVAVTSFRSTETSVDEPPQLADEGNGETVTLLAIDPAVTGIPSGDSEPVLIDAVEPLAFRLDTGSLSSTANQAIAIVLSKWDVAFDSAGEGACVQARAAGLSCLLQRGSINVLRQLDRPAVLTLTGDGGNSYPVALVALHGDVAELVFGEEEVTYPVEEVARLWFGQYLIVWRPPNGTPTSIRPGMRGADVRWLRESLALLGHDATVASEDPDFFDGELEAQVRSFQRNHRLQVDGLAGEQTQIIINSMLAKEGTPRLSSDPELF